MVVCFCKNFRQCDHDHELYCESLLKIHLQSVIISKQDSPNTMIIFFPKATYFNEGNRI